MTSVWRPVALSELLSQKEPDVPVVPTETYSFAGVYSFGRGVFRAQEKAGREFSYRRLSRIRAGDFVYPKLMAWEGAFGVVPPECDGCVVSPEFPVFSVRTDRLLPAFLWAYIRRRPAWESLSGSSTGTNVRRRRLHPDVLLRHEVPLPPLADQRRIVAQIEELNGKRDAVIRLASERDQALEALLLATFHRTASGAPYRPFGEVAPLTRRPVAVQPEGSYPELGIRSFGKGSFHKPPVAGHEVGSKKLFRIEAGDLVFSNVFAWEGAVAVARSADGGRYGSHRFICCVPVTGVATASFLCTYFRTQEGLGKLQEASPGAAGRNRTLGLEALARMTVPVPPVSQQIVVDELREKLEALSVLQRAIGAELDALLPSVLDKAFEGEG